MRFALLLLCSAISAADADLIFYNGKIVTVDRSFSIQEAIALKDGKVLAVGTGKAILAAERGTRTRVIDLGGKTVLPGLTDSHVHPLGAGLSEFRKPIPTLDSYQAVQQYIRDQARTTPEGQWIVVPRTFPTRLREMKMPTREVLDVTGHPVMFDASYVVVANSAALKLSGITRDTPDPPGGEIVKDANGEPNGILRNAQTLLKGVSQAERFTEAEQLDALEGMLKRYREAGLTSILDRAVTADGIALYKKLRSTRGLPVRTAITWRIDAQRPLDQILAQIQSAPFAGGEGDDWLKLKVFKVTLDGGMTIGTAYQRHPYGAFGRQLYGMTNPDDRGQLFIPQDKLTAIFRAARARGWELTAHSQGGGAVDIFLGSMEALNREKPIGPTRSHLMHASFPNPEAMTKAKRLGVLADVQPAWLYLDGIALEKVFGPEGMRYFFPMRSWIDAGIVVAGGSDHMIGHDKNKATNPYNPFLGMWIDVTRRTAAGRVLNPEQRISREEALRSYTSWAAYLQSEESHKGSLEPGKLGDLIVIDRDFLNCPEDQIKDIQALIAVIEGKIAWERPGK